LADAATVAKAVRVCDRIAAIRIRHIMELILDHKVIEHIQRAPIENVSIFNMMYDNCQK